MIKIDAYEFKELEQYAQNTARETEEFQRIITNTINRTVDDLPYTLSDLYKIHDLEITTDDYDNYCVAIENSSIWWYKDYFKDLLNGEMLRVYKYHEDNITLTKNPYRLEFSMWDYVTHTEKSATQLKELLDIIEPALEDVFNKIDNQVDTWVNEAIDYVQTVEGFTEYHDGLETIPYFTEDGNFIGWY